MRHASVVFSSLAQGTALSVEVIALGTAVPPLRMTQKESLDYILTHFDIKESSKVLYKRVFNNSAIETRCFAMAHPDEVLEKDHDRILARFQKWAVALSTESLQKALAQAGLSPRELDYLAVTTCTGYLCPGLSAYLVESCGLRPDIHSSDLVGMGCGAALPALQQAHNFLCANPRATAAVVSTEISSAAMFSGDAPDLIISNTIFADGSAAAVLKARRGGPAAGADGAGPHPRLRDFASLTLPQWRETLRFRTQDGYLRNVLSREVPAQAAEALKRLVAGLLDRHGLAPETIRHWVFHSGGQKILDAIQDSLLLPAEKFRSSREVLRKFGNMSSPTVLFILQEEHGRFPPEAGSWGLMASFGAGFSAHAALLEY